MLDKEEINSDTLPFDTKSCDTLPFEIKRSVNVATDAFSSETLE